ncbi:MAG: type IV secretion system protein [Gemmatimonadota bacterium]
MIPPRRRDVGTRPEDRAPTLSRYRILAAAALAILAVIISSLPATAQAPQVEVTGILDTFETASQAWLGAAQGVGRALFSVLWLLELVVSGYSWAIDKDGVDAILRELAVKVVVAGFMFWMVSNSHPWLRNLVNGLEAVGATLRAGAGAPVMEPVDIQYAAIRINTTIWEAMQDVPPEEEAPGAAGSLNPMTVATNAVHSLVEAARGTVTKIMGLLVMFATMIVVFVSYLVITAQLVITRIQMYVILGAAPFFMAFGACRITAGMMDSYLKWTLQTGVKLALFQMMVGVGLQLTPQWEAAIVASMTRGPTGAIIVALPLLLQVLAGVVIFAYLCWKIPSAFAGVVTGDLQIGSAKLWSR